MATQFDWHIGIDYSGAETPTSRLAGLQVFTASAGMPPIGVRAVPERPAWNWTRRGIAEWLTQLAQSGERFIAGIDHGFSFPHSYFERHALASWPEFLADFETHWPTAEDHIYVDFVRDSNARSGSSSEFRLTERWTSSAKSVFKFDVQGSVAKSTHAGLPWLRRIRDAVGDRVHIWPFDGWTPAAGRSVIAEVYPSIFRNRYLRETRTADQQDAYAVARWLCEADELGILTNYFTPPLPERVRAVAEREGWILGVY